jgi:phage head maturation protease
MRLKGLAIFGPYHLPCADMEYKEFQAGLQAKVNLTNQIARHESKRNKVLQGFANRYGIIHVHKNRKEVFEKGCWGDSLYGVVFLIDHDVLGIKLGDQDDGTLELMDTDAGLAFRLTLSPDDFDRLDGRSEMSVMYKENVVETRTIDNETIRFIKSASLIEISAVFEGAIRKTFAVIRDANSVGLLKDDVKSFASDGAALKFQSALRKLQ